MKLDKDRILELLAEADTKWYQQHSPTSRWSYREHLEFTADHISKNYYKKSKRHSNEVQKHEALGHSAKR